MSIKMRTALFAGALAVTVGAARAEPVTLQDAIARASDAAPALRASDAAIEAAHAGRRQAGVRPNPTLSIEAENFAGTGNYSVLEQPEITATYNQLLERRSKRDARIALAERDVDVAEASRTIARLDLIAATQRAFIDVLIADRTAEATAARLVTERELQREAVRRVRGYKDPLFVETRAAARVADAGIANDLAQVRRRSARAALAAFWGGSGDSLDPSDSFEMAALSSRANTAALADSALGVAVVARASAAVVVEQTRSRQDFTVSGGVRFLRQTNDVALVAGVAIPLGRFDRNRGNIERAQAERRRAEFAAAAMRLDRTRRLAGLRADASSALTRSERITAEVLPRARRALAQVREGYNRGGFTFRDIQDAADAIIATTADLVAAMTAYRDVQSEIDRLTGRFDAAQPMGARP